MQSASFSQDIHLLRNLIHLIIFLTDKSTSFQENKSEKKYRFDFIGEELGPHSLIQLESFNGG